MNTVKLHIAKDMDGVETCWEEAMKNAFRKHLPDLEYKGPTEREIWNIPDNYPEEIRQVIQNMWYEPGFFFNLKPKIGSVESTEWMLSQGYKVSFCTSPVYSNDPKIVNRCIAEKREYLFETYKHLVSPAWFFDPKSPIQFIPVFDKTTIHAHYLIDDKPDVSGAMHPTWKQLLFDEGHPFGKDFYGQRINWNPDSPYYYQHVLSELSRRSKSL